MDASNLLVVYTQTVVILSRLVALRNHLGNWQFNTLM